MAVSIRDARSARADREWIEASYRDYLDDLPAGATGVFPALMVTGQSEAELLAPRFVSERVIPLVILSDLRPVGFALVDREPGGLRHRLSEFYIRREDRRRGLGREAAALIFTRFPGDWLVSESARNAGAIAFWRKVIAAYTRGRYQERHGDGELRHSFSSPPPQGR